MKTITIPTFTHHLLPMLHAGKSETKATKDISQKFASIERPLKLDGRIEVVLVEPGTDFLDLSPGMAAARKAAVQAMGQTERLRWVALTAKPENIGAVAKEGSFGACANLCIGLVATGNDGLDENVEQLRHLPCEHKMLMLHSLTEPPDLHGKLAGLNWLIFCTTAVNAGWAVDASLACRAADIAFLHLNLDEPSGFHFSFYTNSENAADIEDAWREHPFGAKVLLRRKTLKGLEPPDRFTLNLPCSEPQEAQQEFCPSISVMATVTNVSEMPSAVCDEQTATPSAEHDIIKPQVEAAVDTVELPVAKAAAAQEDDITEDATIVCDEEAELVSSDACAEDATAPVEPSFIVVAAEAPLLPCVIGVDDDAELMEFRRLDDIVAKGLKAGLDAGIALMEIRDRKLWKVAGYQNWNQYCEDVRGLTRQYVNEQIKAAATHAMILQVEGIPSTSGTCVPQNVAQLRELFPLKVPEKQALACFRAAERIQGPLTATVLRDVVAEIMAEEDTPPKVCKPGRKELLTQNFESLRAAVSSNASQEELLAMIKVIEELAR